MGILLGLPRNRCVALPADRPTRNHAELIEAASNAHLPVQTDDELGRVVRTVGRL